MDQVRCNKCALSKHCKNIKIEGAGSTHPKLLVVFGHPNEGGDTTGILNVSELFSSVLFEAAGCMRDDVYFAYAVKCHPLDKKITKTHTDACSPYLSDEINLLNPTTILAVGDLALKVLTGKTGVGKLRGRTILTEVEGVSKTPVIPVFEPSYVYKNSNMMDLWARDILKAVNMSLGHTISQSSTKVVYCDTFNKIRELVGYCQQTGVACFDHETLTIDKKKGTFKEGHKSTALSISFQAGSAWVIPMEHFESPFNKEEVQEIMDYLKVNIWENPKVRKIAHNLNYDLHINRLYGCSVLRGRIDDTQLMHHLYDETKLRGLKDLVATFFTDFSGYESELDGMKWDDIPLSILVPYAGTDTDMTLRLSTLLESFLLEDPRLYKVYRNISMAVFRPLWEAEARGANIDRKFLSDAIKEVDGHLEQQYKKIMSHKVIKRFEIMKTKQAVADDIADQQHKLSKWLENHRAGTKSEENYRKKIAELKSGVLISYAGINFNSAPQMQDLLYFNEHGFRFNSLDTSTGKDVIEALKDSSGFIDSLLLFRSMNKMQGTYLRGIYERLDADGFVHTNFRIDGTVTGRLSSRNPNLQNIPNPYKLSDETAIHIVSLVKKAFTPREGRILAQVDYSQAELRVIASFANEMNMLGVYDAGGDIHATTAAVMLGISIEDFYKLPKAEQKKGRSNAKAVNFGFIYGMGAVGFKEYARTDYKLILTDEQSVDMRNAFFKAYPKLLEYHDLYREKGRRYGWVRTLFGRKRRLPDINGADSYKSSDDERNAVNSPIQGTAGEFTLFSIAILYNRIPKDCMLVNTVHDSIIFDLKKEDANKALKTIAYACENLPTQQYFGKTLKSVGMAVDVEISEDNWGSLSEYEII